MGLANTIGYPGTFITFWKLMLSPSERNCSAAALTMKVF